MSPPGPASDALSSPPLISALIEAHRASIDCILASLVRRPDDDADVQVDALFALRFLLSSKTLDADEAAENARATLQWRRSNAAMLAAAARGDLPHAQTFNTFIKMGYARRARRH